MSTVLLNQYDESLSDNRGISIFSLSWNCAEFFKKSLLKIRIERQILEQEYNVPTELLIVDNGSMDGTQEFLRSLPDSNTTILLNEKNLGVSLGRNQGFDIFKGKYLILIDGDNIPVENSFACMYKYMEDNPDVGCLGCPQDCQTHLPESVTKRLEAVDKISEGLRNPCYKNGSRAYTNYGIFRGELFRKHGIRMETGGPFSKPGWGEEDNDLGMQIDKAGFAIKKFEAMYYLGELHSSWRSLGTKGKGATAENIQIINQAERSDYIKKKWGIG